jgi:hypothetical protein
MIAIQEDNIIDKKLNIVTSFGDIKADSSRNTNNINNIIITEVDEKSDYIDISVINNDIDNIALVSPAVASFSTTANPVNPPTFSSFKNIPFELNDEPTEFNVEEFKVKEGELNIIESKENPVILVPIVN